MIEIADHKRGEMIGFFGHGKLPMLDDIHMSEDGEISDGHFSKQV